MALKSNRVGVRTDQVDAYGRVISKPFFQSILDHLPRWTSLKVWKNGTEQLLPVNTDEPVTSPIVADIQYPTDSSATEQMFTYRESPTDADGEAYIQSIKGNTLVWNQLLQELNSTYWVSSSTTPTFSDNSVSFTATAQYGQVYLKEDSSFTTVTGHKYLFLATVKLATGTTLVNVQIRNVANTVSKSSLATQSIISEQYLSGVYAEDNGELCRVRVIDTRTSEWGEIIVKNIMVFDLTKMFGSTKADEIYAMETAQAGRGVSYFKSLFRLSYYQYDAGSLLSFNGTGIKTTGKNQLAKPFVYYSLAPNTLDECFYVKKGTYTFKFTSPTATTWRVAVRMKDANGNNLNDEAHKPYQYMTWYSTNNMWMQGSNSTTSTIPITIAEDCYVRFLFSLGETTASTVMTDAQLELGSTATAYEPYITSTTTIPTDTYFPTGMKSADSAYDEFTSSRAYTRMWEYSFTGSEVWSFDSESQFFGTTISVESAYQWKRLGKNICSNGIICALTNTQVRVYLDVNPNLTSESDLNTVFTSSVKMHYELAEEIIEPTLEFDEE